MTSFHIASLLLTIVFSSLPQQPSSKPLVPDQETAIKIAEAIWVPMYGIQVCDLRPYSAELQNGNWYVKGILPHSRIEVGSNGDSVLHVVGGGVPYIHISARTGEVIAVGHSK